MRGNIDHLDDLPKELTCAMLRVHTFTGQDCVAIGNRGMKEHTYRNGVITELGDIRTDIWMAAVRHLVEQNGEQAVLENLVEWLRKLPWLRTQREKEAYALRLYANRIWLNPEWVGYEDFQEKYGTDGRSEQMSMFGGEEMQG